VTKVEIFLIKSLSDKKERSLSGLFVAEGEKLVGEIAASGMTVDKIFFTAEKSPLNTGKIPTEKISAKEMERISNLKTPSGVLALVKIPEYEFDAASFSKGHILALDNIQDPGNMGTIIRTADWFGIEDIVCSETSADCFNPKVVQATMGAITRVRVHYVNLPETLRNIAAGGAPVYGTFLEGENIYDTGLSENGVIVLGNEGQGISQEVARLVTKKLFIPPYPAGKTSSESLNVSAACAIACSVLRMKR